MRPILLQKKPFDRAGVSPFYDLLPLPCILINASQEIVYVNKALCQLIDFNDKSLVGKHWYSLFADVENQDKLDVQSQLSHPRTLTQHKKKLLTRSHVVLEGLLEISVLNTDAEHQNLILLTFQVAPNPGIGATMRLLQNAIDNQPNGLVIATENQQIIYANQAFCQQTGYSLGELLGNHSSWMHPPEKFESLVKPNQHWRGCYQVVCRDGYSIWVKETITPLINRDGETSHYLINIAPFQPDFQEANTRPSKIHKDSLTGLLSRDGFEDRVTRLLSHSEAEKNTHTFCRIDIDQFRVINGSCGHHGGDTLLCQIARILEQQSNAEDIIGRYGADEFVLLLTHCPPEIAVKRLEKIRAQIQSQSLVWDNQRYPVSVSIGAVPVDEKPKSYTELLLHADTACHTAKLNGRNRITFYQENTTVDPHQNDELYWILAINRALEDDLFVIFAQPISRPKINAGEPPHYEILIRYQDDAGNKIYLPNHFMPTAENHRLTPQIDRWVIQHSLQTMGSIISSGKMLPFFSINLSGHSLSQENLVDYIIEQIETNNVPAENLCFEITETAAILNLDLANQFIDKLQMLGCSISLDDFGSGLSSFAYLKHLSIDYLKIDGMFVKNLRYDPIDLSMVRSITEIGHVMGKEIIAEWVEDEQTAQILEELDVDYIQGFWVGKPEPLDHIIEKLPLKENPIPSVE